MVVALGEGETVISYELSGWQVVESGDRQKTTGESRRTWMMIDVR
jgi:hypothetical protein